MQHSGDGNSWKYGGLVLAACLGLALAVPMGCHQPSEDLSTLDTAGAVPRDTGPGPMGEGLSDRLPYALTTGDQLGIKVYGIDEVFGESYRVDTDGGFHFPYVGYVKVDGLTTRDVTRKLNHGLLELYVSPEVVVNLVSEEQQYVNVLGEVLSPGRLRMQRGMTIIDALTASGGPNLNANREKIILIRRTAEDQISAGYFNYIDATLNPMGGAMSSNIELQRGDTIVVASSSKAQWERAFQFVSAMFNPIVDVERAITLYPDVRDILKTGDKSGNTTIVVR